MTQNKSYLEANISKHSHFKLTDSSDVKPPKVLAFVHTPKTGGTNIDRLFYCLSDDDSNHQIYYKRFSVKRRKDRSPNLFSEGCTGGFPDSLQLSEERKLIKIDKERAVFSSHMPVGIHHKQGFEDTKYISIIRNPVERELCSINFDYQRGFLKIDSVEEKDKSVSDYSSTMIDNLQTRIIAGKEYMSGECTEETLKVAKENIDKKFLFVAPIEELNDAMSVLFCLYGKKDLTLASCKFQVTGDKIYDSVDIIPDKLRLELEEKTKFDRELHKYAKEKWKEFLEQNFISVEIDNDTEFYAMSPDTFITKKASIMSEEQISKHNKVQQDLLCVQQPHASKSSITR